MMGIRLKSRKKEQANVLPICLKDQYLADPASSQANLVSNGTGYITLQVASTRLPEAEQVSAFSACGNRTGIYGFAPAYFSGPGRKRRLSPKLTLLVLVGTFNAALAMDIAPQPGEYGYVLCQPQSYVYLYRRECEVWLEGQYGGLEVGCLNRKLPFPWDSETLLIPKSIDFYGGVSATGGGWLSPGQTLPYNGCWQGPPSYSYGIETSNVQAIVVTMGTGGTASTTAARSRTVSCDSAYYDTLPNGACRLKGADPGKNNNICEAGDNGSNPIHSATGSKLQREVDYVGSGSNRLRFVRHYTSAKTMDLGGLGRHWQHNYSRKVVFVDSMLATASVSRENGDSYHFNFDAASGLWVGDPDVNGKLMRMIDANGLITGWQYSSDDQTELYDGAGKLISVRHRDGMEETLSYSTAATPAAIAPAPGLLIKVEDAFGRSLNFVYDIRGRIVRMIDPAGTPYQYGYDLANNLATVTYPDDTPADSTDNPKKTYLYGELEHTANVSRSYALTGLIDENNKRFATWDYNAEGRAISSEHAGGVDKTTLTFNADGTTSVTDPLGSARKFRFQLIHGVYKSVGVDQPGGSGCAASASNIGYDDNGNVAYRVDFNGNRTNSVFDLVRNLETSRTEGLTATGASTPETRTIETEWHPTFRLPVRITEPGLETAIAYDDKGRITHTSRKDLASQVTREWHTVYTDSATVPGALLQKVEDGPHADVSDLTTHDYYPPDAVCTGGHLGCRGQLKQIASALGHVTRITRYSAHGQPEEIVDPNGLVTTLVYDARQRLVSSDIGGEVTAYQYDPAGQMTRITEPSGAYLAYRYDEAHRLIEIKDHLGNTLSYTLDAKGNRLKEDLSDPMGRLVRRREQIYDALSRLQNIVQAQ
jgi:YD repeat-containing protein